MYVKMKVEIENLILNEDKETTLELYYTLEYELDNGNTVNQSNFVEYNRTLTTIVREELIHFVEKGTECLISCEIVGKHHDYEFDVVI